MLDTKFPDCPSLTNWATYSRRALFHDVQSWTTAEKISITARMPSNKQILERFLCAPGAMVVCVGIPFHISFLSIIIIICPLIHLFIIAGTIR
jgi:hypothetical protein